jgi:hypothetical protein
MVNNLKEEFKIMLNEYDWMDSISKQAALEKVMPFTCNSKSFSLFHVFNFKTGSNDGCENRLNKMIIIFY